MSALKPEPFTLINKNFLESFVVNFDIISDNKAFILEFFRH